MKFAKKQFQGTSYSFGHLGSFSFIAALNAAGTLQATIHVTFSCHCFTEAFDAQAHTPDYRYEHDGEIRAFNLVRYNASTDLPRIVQGMLRGMVYLADRKNYTYVAHARYGISDPYSLFFSLRRKNSVAMPGVQMHVRSAYHRDLAAPRHAKAWRFSSLVGEVSGAFTPPAKGMKPTRRQK